MANHRSRRNQRILAPEPGSTTRTITFNPQDLPIPTQTFYANSFKSDQRHGLLSLAFGQAAAGHRDSIHSAVGIDIPAKALKLLIPSLESLQAHFANDALPQPFEFPETQATNSISYPGHVFRLTTDEFVSTIDVFALQPTAAGPQIAAQVRIYAPPSLMAAMMQACVRAATALVE